MHLLIVFSVVGLRHLLGGQPLDAALVLPFLSEFQVEIK